MAERWPRRRNAFGFYFSAHPVDRFRALADAQGARTFARSDGRAAVDGERTRATMAACVEDGALAHLQQGGASYDAPVRPFRPVRTPPSSRTRPRSWSSKRPRPANACCSASNWTASRARRRRASRSAASPVSMRCHGGHGYSSRFAADDPAAIVELARLLETRRGGSSAVRLRVHHGRGEAELLLGRDFLVDGELAAQVERILGVTATKLSAEAKPQLQLVG
jgi:DNA polymerase-3 subunit alpha